MQIGIALRQFFQIQWPSNFTLAIELWSPALNVDIFSLPGVGCLLSQGHRSVFWSFTITPLLVLGGMAMAYRRGTWTRTKFYNTTVALLFLVYPRVTSVVLSTFSCEEMANGSSFLKADYSVECDGAYKAVYFTAGAVFFCVYCIGVPLLFFGLLQMYRGELYNPITNKPLPRARDEVGSLYVAFEPEAYWWEIVEMLRKLVLCGLLQYIEPGSALQIAVALTISVVYGFFAAFASPFVDDMDDNVNGLCNLMVVGLGIFALLMKAGFADTPGYGEDTAGIFLIVIVYGSCGAVVAAIMYQMLFSRMMAKFRKKKKANTLLQMSFWAYLTNPSAYSERMLDENAALQRAVPGFLGVIDECNERIDDLKDVQKITPTLQEASSRLRAASSALGTAGRVDRPVRDALRRMAIMIGAVTDSLARGSASWGALQQVVLSRLILEWLAARFDWPPLDTDHENEIDVNTDPEDAMTDEVVRLHRAITHFCQLIKNPVLAAVAAENSRKAKIHPLHESKEGDATKLPLKDFLHRRLPSADLPEAPEGNAIHELAVLLCSETDLPKVRRMLSDYPKLPLAVNASKQTALHLAIMQGAPLAVVRMLLLANAKPANKEDKLKRIPLDYATALLRRARAALARKKNGKRSGVGGMLRSQTRRVSMVATGTSGEAARQVVTQESVDEMTAVCKELALWLPATVNATITPGADEVTAHIKLVLLKRAQELQSKPVDFEGFTPPFEKAGGIKAYLAGCNRVLMKSQDGTWPEQYKTCVVAPALAVTEELLRVEVEAAVQAEAMLKRVFVQLREGFKVRSYSSRGPSYRFVRLL